MCMDLVKQFRENVHVQRSELQMRDDGICMSRHHVFDEDTVVFVNDDE